MSNVIITTPTKGVDVVVGLAAPRPFVVAPDSGVDVTVGTPGPKGPTGPEGKWVSMTFAEYQALPMIDPDVLYVIIG